MSRMVFGLVLVLGLMVCPLTIGCGDGGNTVIEDDRSAVDVEQANADYEKSMQEGDKEAAEGPK